MLPFDSRALLIVWIVRVGSLLPVVVGVDIGHLLVVGIHHDANLGPVPWSARSAYLFGVGRWCGDWQQSQHSERRWPRHDRSLVELSIGRRPRNDQRVAPPPQRRYDACDITPGRSHSRAAGDA